MKSCRLAYRSLFYYWRTNLAVALGVMAATAVLTGALVVGDSVRGSLRALVLDRLGSINAVLATPHFFRTHLAHDVAGAPGFQEHFAAAVPAILLQGTLENPASEHRHRAGQVTVLGVDAALETLGQGSTPPSPAGDEIVLNQPLADELHVKPGDEVVLRLPQTSHVPADSPLGRKTETVRSRRFTVSAIIPAKGLGRFGLRPTQQLPLNAFTSIKPLQQMLEVENRVNAILITGNDPTQISAPASEKLLADSLHPTLDDYGVKIEKTPHGYFNLTTERMVLEPAIERAARKAFAGETIQPAYTYLANYILTADGKGKIPYSTIAAVDFTAEPPLGPLVNREGKKIPPLRPGEIVLNSWAADDLAAQGSPVKPGDTIEITYFQPESTHGQVVQSWHTFRLKDIAQLAGAANDRHFTPEVKGVTDEDSIANWDPPFPYDPSRVRSTPPNDQDDRYWQEYRATPKAFVSLEQGRKLWSSRFGQTTSLRIAPRDDMAAESLAKKLEQAIDPVELGFEFLPVKRLGLAAATGTTPFAVLFLLFSMFIIAAALMLIMLLFRLGLDYRAAELGLVLAVGVRHAKARRLWLTEGAMVAAAGALAGTFVGVGYAWLMLTGLKTWWLGAISTPFLDLYVSPTSLLVGFLAGVAVSLATIAWALRRTRKVSVRRLLGGTVEESLAPIQRRRWAPVISIACILGAIILAVAAMRTANQSQAGVFFGSGALVLIAALAWMWDRLRHQSSRSLVGQGAALVRLAIRNSSRFPLRSILSIGLMAAACFLIVAVSAFQLDPPAAGPQFTSGDGGFAWIAQTDQPIFQDLNASDARRELGFDDRADQLITDAAGRGARIYPLRVQAGDDASCLNLYQSRQPRILGLPPAFLHRGGFAWSASAAGTAEEKSNPWLLLSKTPAPSASTSPPPTPDSRPLTPIPVVLDENTALYSLHLYGGVGETFEIDNPRGGKITLQVAGLLKNSIFQGDLLISEADFFKLFPDISGYRMFLIAVPGETAIPSLAADSRSNRRKDSPPTDPQNLAANPQIIETLESNLGDFGFDAQSTHARLAAFFAVQNTYLATFRSLGGLGLLLGTFGLAAAQLRSIAQRRGELALLRATGFRRSRLTQMVLLENLWLLAAGLGLGTLAALAVLLPHLFTGGAAIPWLSLAALVAIIFLAGLTASLAAVRFLLRAPLLSALRHD